MPLSLLDILTYQVNDKTLILLVAGMMLKMHIFSNQLFNVIIINNITCTT